MNLRSLIKSFSTVSTADSDSHRSHPPAGLVSKGASKLGSNQVWHGHRLDLRLCGTQHHFDCHESHAVTSGRRLWPGRHLCRPPKSWACSGKTNPLHMGHLLGASSHCCVCRCDRHCDHFATSGRNKSWVGLDCDGFGCVEPHDPCSLDQEDSHVLSHELIGSCCCCRHPAATAFCSEA